MRMTAKLLTTISLAAFAAAADARQAPPEPLGILSISATQAAEPGQMIITGTGLELVEHVFLGGEEALIVSKTPTTLVFLPREGDPGMQPVVVATPFERLEASAMFMPCLTVKAQDAFWGEGHGRFLVPDNVFGLHLDSGAPGFYVLMAGNDMRSVPLILDPGTRFEFWLADPYRILEEGAIPGVDRFVLQHRLPAELMGETLFFQALVLQDFGTHGHRSFTNVERMELF